MKSDETPQVDPADVQQLSILQAALTVGPIAFLIVVIGLLPAPVHETIPEGAFQQIELFSAVHAFTALGCIGAALVIPKMLMAQRKEIGIGDLRSTAILRMAFLEGAALFGATVIFLAKQNGVLAEQPLIYANAGSTAILVVISLMTFPTQAKLEGQLRDGAAGL